MPKIKTNRSAAKRFKATGKGVKRGKAYASHNLACKDRKRKRRLRKNAMLDSANLRQVRKLVPTLF